jgi:hypothetical protein
MPPSVKLETQPATARLPAAWGLGRPIRTKTIDEISLSLGNQAETTRHIDS